MYVELLIISGCGLFAALLLDKENRKIRSRWRNIVASQDRFTNKLKQTLRILDIDKTDFGHEIYIELPYGYTYTDLIKDLDVFKEGLEYEKIETEKEVKDNKVKLMCYS